MYTHAFKLSILSFILNSFETNCLGFYNEKISVGTCMKQGNYFRATSFLPPLSVLNAGERFIRIRQIVSNEVERCLRFRGGQLQLIQCFFDDEETVWKYTKSGFLMHKGHDGCLGVHKRRLHFRPCPYSSWIIKSDDILQYTWPVKPLVKLTTFVKRDPLVEQDYRIKSDQRKFTKWKMWFKDTDNPDFFHDICIYPNKTEVFSTAASRTSTACTRYFNA